MSETIKERIKTALRIALGACFTLSGTLKAVNVLSFAQEIRLYIEAYMDNRLIPRTVGIAVVICTIETATGLLALMKKSDPIAPVAFAGIMSFFVWLTGINLFCPSIMGSIESCGCFGELIHFSPFASFVKSVALWTMAAVLLGLCIKDTKQPVWNTDTGKLLFSSVAAGAALPLFSYFCFERMEHENYLAAYIGLCITLLSGFVYVKKKQYL